MSAAPSDVERQECGGVLNLSGKFLIKVIETAGKDQICLLHGYEGYPNVIPSDVDAIISPRGLRSILQNKFEGWTCVQCLRHESFAYYLVYVNMAGEQPVFVALDLALDCRKDGCVFYDHHEILSCVRHNPKGLPVPPPAIEFTYYITKKIGKIALDCDQAARLSDLWKLDAAACRRELSRFLPANVVEVVASAVETGDWRTTKSELKKIRRSMFLKMMAVHPWKYFTYYFLEIRRLYDRLTKPTGLVVCVLGPDGAGKSTLLNFLDAWLSHAFRNTIRYHFRPRWGWARDALGKPVTNPHAQPQRSQSSSVVHLAWWFADGSVGCFFAAYLKKVRSSLILFDRYFYDVLVDPRRYRYGGPMWLVRVAVHAIIKSDICFVLDAPVADLRSRKEEVAFQESERQRRAYLDLAARMRNTVVIKASERPELVAKHAATEVLTYLAARTAVRLSSLVI
jgi:thymidylate kinase